MEQTVNPTAPLNNPTFSVSKESRIAIICIGVFMVLAISLVAFFYYQNQQLKSMLAKYTAPTPTPEATTDPFSGWKTYTSDADNYLFRFPKEWNQIPPPPIQDSSNNVVFQSTDGLYRLTISSQLNKNKVTGKMYKSLDEFIGLPYVVKALIVDNQEARQPLPRAGSESTNKVYFFSKDSKFIFSIELLIGDGTGTDHRVTVDALQIGSDVFDKIVSSFKFTGTNTLVIPTPTINDVVSSPSGSVCTQEARICPDGTSVGRHGPNCDFAECPTPITTP